MATHPSVFCSACRHDPCTCRTVNEWRMERGLPPLELVEPLLYSPRIPRIRWRHLQYLPAAVATVAAALTLGVLSGFVAVLITAGSYVGTAAVIAAVDLFMEWRQERRRDKAIEQTIGIYPITSSRHPKHVRRHPA